MIPIKGSEKDLQLKEKIHHFFDLFSQTTRLSYLDYLRNSRTNTITAANTCHSPETGEFCTTSGAIESHKLTATLSKKLNKESVEEFYNQCHEESGVNGGRFCGGSEAGDAITGHHTPSTIHALDAIDSVHSMPSGVTKIPVETQTSGSDSGGLISNNGKPVKIIVSPKSPYKEFTFTHEFGHYVDHEIPGMSSEILKTIHQSPTSKTLAKQKPGDGYFDYLREDDETFARAYSQYIANRSNSPQLKAQVEKARSFNDNSQWTDQEFEPISQAFDRYFQGKGLLKGKTSSGQQIRGLPEKSPKREVKDGTRTI